MIDVTVVAVARCGIVVRAVPSVDTVARCVVRDVVEMVIIVAIVVSIVSVVGVVAIAAIVVIGDSFVLLILLMLPM